MLHGTELGVLLQCEAELRVDVVGRAQRRREIEVPDAAVEVRVENGIEDQVPATQMPADDRTDLAREAGRLPVRSVVAELEVDTIEELALLRVGDHEQGAELGAVEQQIALV